MAEMNKIDRSLLESVADLHKIPEGAYNIRKNGQSLSRSSSANIQIESKTDKPGIDITIKPFTKNESVHIPVILTESGMNDMVYNDFYIGEGADVLITGGFHLPASICLCRRCWTSRNLNRSRWRHCRLR